MALLHFYSQAKREHSIITNAASRRQQAVPHQVADLIANIESHGATVTNADEFRALIEYQAPEHTAPDPFATDPADAHTTVTEHALRTQKDNEIRMLGAWSDYLTKAARAILESMATEADDYLDAMRPDFDTAAAKTTTVLALGLDENTTYGSLVEDSTPEVLDAWRDYLDARTVLDRIAGTRIAMSAWLDLPPQRNARYISETPDYTPAFTPATESMGPDPSRISENSLTHRWLTLQNADGTGLRLTSIRELEALGYRNGSGAYGRA